MRLFQRRFCKGESLKVENGALLTKNSQNHFPYNVYLVRDAENVVSSARFPLFGASEEITLSYFVTTIQNLLGDIFIHV